MLGLVPIGRSRKDKVRRDAEALKPIIRRKT